MHSIKNPTLILGLGGSGYLTVSRIKQLYWDYYKQELPTALKFLCIDFDNCENNKAQYKKVFGLESMILSERDMSAEWIKVSSRISSREYEESIKSPAVGADTRFISEDTNTKKLYASSIPTFDLSAGAGQKRILGKIGISYPENYNKIFNKIKEMLSVLLSINIEGVDSWDKITVNIVSSCSGGAGSGMFLDILFMLYKLTGTGKEIEIVTFNYLPDVFLNSSYPNIFKNLVEPNAFGTICELEYIYEHMQAPHENVDFAKSEKQDAGFRPTYFDKPLKTISKLPKANFLINNRSFGGANISYKSMIYSTAKVIANLNLSGNGLDSQWSNFQSFLAENLYEKSRSFCSFGYAEIIFNPIKLEDFFLAQVIKKTLSDYDDKKNDNKNIEGCIQELKNLRSRLDYSLFADEKSFEEFQKKVAKIIYHIPSTESKNASEISEDAKIKKMVYENSIATTLLSYLSFAKIKKIVHKEANRIVFGTTTKSDSEKLITEFRQELAKLLIREEDDEEYASKKKACADNYNYKIIALAEQPKAFVVPIFKIKYTLNRSGYWDSQYFEKLKSLSDFLTNDYRKIFIKEEMIAFWNRNLTGLQEILDQISSKQSEKIYWLKTENKDFELPNNHDNIIYLESYFLEMIKEEIKSDPDINSSVIEAFYQIQSEVDPGIDRTEQYLREFTKLIANTSSYAELQKLKAMDLYELKAKLKKEQQQQITNKVAEVLHPLWDRQKDYTLMNGNVKNDGYLIKFKRMQIPASPLENKEYFGVNQFDINAGDIYESEDDKHRQLLIELELGLPAMQINNIVVYKDTFDAIMVDADKKQSVNFFAYNQIREAIVNNTAGILKKKAKD